MTLKIIGAHCGHLDVKVIPLNVMYIFITLNVTED